MSADAKALRLFGVARDSIEASAAGQPEPEPEPQPENLENRSKCFYFSRHCSALFCARRTEPLKALFPWALALGFVLTVFVLVETKRK